MITEILIITHVVIHAVIHDDKNSDTIGMIHMTKLITESKNIFVTHIK